MATTTATATTFNNPPLVSSGAECIALTGTFNSGATVLGTAGDTVFLAKIPHGAIIVDAREDHSSGATSSIYSFGLTTGGPSGQAALAQFVVSGAGATVNRATVASVPIQVSASDLDPNRYGILSMTATGGQASATTSLIINWTIWYTTRGQY